MVTNFSKALYGNELCIFVKPIIKIKLGKDPVWQDKSLGKADNVY